MVVKTDLRETARPLWMNDRRVLFVFSCVVGQRASLAVSYCAIYAGTSVVV